MIHFFKKGFIFVARNGLLEFQLGTIFWNENYFVWSKFAYIWFYKCINVSGSWGVSRSQLIETSYNRCLILLLQTLLFWAIVPKWISSDYNKAIVLKMVFFATVCFDNVIHTSVIPGILRLWGHHISSFLVCTWRGFFCAMYGFFKKWLNDETTVVSRQVAHLLLYFLYNLFKKKLFFNVTV